MGGGRPKNGDTNGNKRVERIGVLLEKNETVDGYFAPSGA